jgi:hypothetical protein
MLVFKLELMLMLMLEFGFLYQTRPKPGSHNVRRDEEIVLRGCSARLDWGRRCVLEWCNGAVSDASDESERNARESDRAGQRRITA